MIFSRGKNCVTTAIRRTVGGEAEAVIIVGTSESDCARHAGLSIARAMKAIDEVSWNSGSGNEITVFRETDECSEGDRYVTSRLVTVSETGRRIEHAPSRRANPSWEGLAECEVCHRRMATVAGIYGTIAGREILACRKCRKTVEMANRIAARRPAAASAAAAPPTG